MCIRDSLKCHGIVIPLRTPSAPLLRSLAFLPIILICLRQYYLPLSLSQEFGLCSELLLHCILILLGLRLLLFYLFQVSLSGVQEFSRTLFAFSARGGLHTVHFAFLYRGIFVFPIFFCRS